ncbi:MAG: CheY-like chemotaxis protein [Paraglaciecola sp.]
MQDNSKPHLLIAEDNPDVIFYICSILEPFYQIMTAADGAEGIDKAL